MMFGLSFGSKKQSTTQNTAINKNETTNQAKSGTNTTTGQNTSSTTGTQNNTTSGQNVSNNATSTNTNQTGTQTQQGSTQALSDPILSGLDSGITQLIGQIFDPENGDRAYLTRGMSAFGDFDVDSFVNSTVQSAMASEGTQLGSVIRGITDMVGGNAGENSMAAIMQSKLADESAARIGGVAADARMRGEQVQNERLGQITNASMSSGGMLANVLNALKGGKTTQSGQTVDQQTQSQSGNAQGTTSATETGSQSSNQQQNTTQMVTEVINELLRGLTNTTGTEDTTGTTKQKGFGLGLSL